MIRLFNTTVDCREKINFVDDRNVVVGFEVDQRCCERFGWWIDDEERVRELREIDSDDDPRLLEYHFDAEYTPVRDADVEVGATDDDDGRATIVLTLHLLTDKGNVGGLYLHLHNNHNGYYSHGVDVNVAGKQTHEFFL
jgi:hypothetical protein